MESRSTESMLRPTSAMLYSTTTSIMMATSPKRVSMSTMATELLVLRPGGGAGGCFAGEASAPSLLLLQDAVDGPRQLFRPRRLDEVVAGAGDHRPPDGGRVGEAGGDDDRGLRQGGRPGPPGRR